jgi:hypothetical protein
MELGCDQPDATGMVTLLISHCGPLMAVFRLKLRPIFRFWRWPLCASQAVAAAR